MLKNSTNEAACSIPFSMPSFVRSSALLHVQTRQPSEERQRGLVGYEKRAYRLSYHTCCCGVCYCGGSRQQGISQSAYIHFTFLAIMAQSKGNISHARNTLKPIRSSSR